ncbi:hypothetical protein AGABI1DRAFT_135248 [Agaricus bisporus var. burnettii JB137-S8]|uniref:Uncharacterized protein n=1 Tax=Agaricus bisporus var. burnettii (strain JB137-S8 / ATCC MYA-4627 / FGSC 10392) TaxID=597362 RepID=K5XFU0_AGABU|nr:uncharacterized protein AGABI1DRAFT_135248 [Agaricus bisporus var. burnettii JB137-S8]EKM73245.1 hypothetical protein AGABI1DRAFT_135248 [Agaricus bisporus var. burnettii JB137-S8]
MLGGPSATNPETELAPQPIPVKSVLPERTLRVRCRVVAFSPACRTTVDARPCFWIALRMGAVYVMGGLGVREPA